MKFKALGLAVLAAISSTSFAQGNTFFASADVTDLMDADVQLYSLYAQYYFAPIENRGPFNEFDFLITESNIAASYSRADFTSRSSDIYGVSGELFYGDFLIGGSYVDNEFDNSSSLRLGYLLSSNFLIAVDLPSDGPADAIVRGTYQHELGNGAYIGFTASLDSEIENATIAARYFTPISNGRYMAFFASYADQEFGSELWIVGGDYYFNKSSSIGAEVNDNFVAVNASHFFTPQLSVQGGYTFSNDDFSSDLWRLSLAYQF